jgi:HK97 family phage major capsid protein
VEKKQMAKKMMMPAIAVAAMMAARPVGAVGAVHMEASPEALLKDVQAQLSKLNGEVKQTAEKALAEAKNSGEVSAETKKTADQLLTLQNGMSDALKALTDKLEGVEQSNLEVAQAVAAGGRGGASSPVSLGRAVANEGADEIKAYLARGASGSMSFDVQNAITTAAGSGGGLITHPEETEVVNMPRRVLRVAGLISAGRTGSDLVTYRKQTLRTNAAAAIAETGAYPESAFGWSKATAQVKKVGHVTNISEEALADADQLQTEIDTEMVYGLELERENQVLFGDGVDENLHGLVPQAVAFAAAAGLPNANQIDRLRLGVLQVALADYVADTIVLNSTDWAAIELLKNGAGDDRYVFGNPATGNAPMLWGKQVVDTNSMTAGEWLVGDLRMAATLYERSGVEILISSEHGDNFVKDMLTMKARQRLALAVKRAAALVTGDFTFA